MLIRFKFALDNSKSNLSFKNLIHNYTTLVLYYILLTITVFLNVANVSSFTLHINTRSLELEEVYYLRGTSLYTTFTTIQEKYEVK